MQGNAGDSAEGITIGIIYEQDLTPPPINSWSYSTLTEFELCPQRVWFRKVSGLAGKPKGTAAARGVSIHDLCEQYVRGHLEKPPVESLHGPFRVLREAFDEGKVICEERWGVDANWEPLDDWESPDLYGKMILDAFVQEDPSSARVIDYKTGKLQYKEVKYANQLLLYSIVAFMRHPELQFISGELWMLDENHIVEKNYTREQTLSFLPSFEKRIERLISCTDFIPLPSKFGCRYCDYRDHCEVAL